MCVIYNILYTGLSTPRVLGFNALMVMLSISILYTDSSLFIFHRGSNIAYLLLYIDDIILTASSSAFLQWVITSLRGEFAMTDLRFGELFSWHSVQQSFAYFFLSYPTYAMETLERAHMQKCNPCWTHGDPISDPTLYRSLAGALQYFTFTRHDIFYAIQ